MTARTLTTVGPLFKLEWILSHGGMTRSEILSLCEAHFDVEGDEALTEDDTRWMLAKMRLRNEADEVRRAWFRAFPDDRNTRREAEARKAAEGVTWDRNRGDAANMYAQQEAKAHAAERFDKREPFPTDQFAAYAKANPEQEAQWVRDEAQIDRLKRWPTP